MKIEGVNHIALRVREAERSAEFYKYYCGMEIVQQRTEGDLSNIWVRLPNQKDGFMLVLFETLTDSTASSGTMDHIGIYVESRKDVDEIAERARAAGVLVDGPSYAGEIVGYYCMVEDPDGNLVEFSCEQMRV
jgi:catechol 2,3-dioxygenase-like lactoylglutathione lyase family enzyme